MKNRKFYKTRVGIFIVLGTLLLVAALYFIGNRQHIFSQNIQLYAVFQNVNGLQLGNNVRYSGINVGTVSSIDMINTSEIVVQMMIEAKTAAFISKDAIASIGSDGLVGSMVVNITPGKDNLKVVVSRDTIISYSKIGTDDMLSTLNVTNENAALLTSDLLKITNKILEGEGALGALVSDSILSKDIKETLKYLKQTTYGTNKAVKNFNTLISKIDLEESPAGILLTDSIAGNQIKNVFSQLETSSNSIAEVTKMLDEMVADMKNNENTLNYIIKDESLPKNIDTTMVHLKMASKKLNANLEAMKSNFLFRRYFRKQARQERRIDKIKEKDEN
ncbi:MlaD family protein [Spongiivirga citrea]|uniref:MCE family protein n=1 Tax=Spongiivirga citrea TaxID=1481457 RepID=A0A6M0CSM3_9FLAO|nr:MlaD family protein [Spongiivirga citrea]NER16850.1 MCE family protein [Spongiivirga citrea]